MKSFENDLLTEAGADPRKLFTSLPTNIKSRSLGSSHLDQISHVIPFAKIAVSPHWHILDLVSHSSDV